LEKAVGFNDVFSTGEGVGGLRSQEKEGVYRVEKLNVESRKKSGGSGNSDGGGIKIVAKLASLGFFVIPEKMGREFSWLRTCSTVPRGENSGKDMANGEGSTFLGKKVHSKRT